MRSKSPKKAPVLSVVIPAYNEEKNLKRGVLEAVYRYLSQQKFPYEVLIVDDGSADQTRELVKKFIQGKPGFLLVENPHGGKALTVMTGMLKARGKIVLFTDMDQATPLSEVDKFFPQFERGYDVVIGSRKGRKGAPLIRKLAAWIFAFLRNLILGLPFHDTQCGFKAFTREAVKKVFPGLLERWKGLRAQGAAVNAGFDVEALFVAKSKGLKIAEVEVEWHHVGTERVQLLTDALEAIKVLLALRWRALQGKIT